MSSWNQKLCKHVVFRENPSCENGLKKTNKILILFIEIKKKFFLNNKKSTKLPNNHINCKRKHGK